MWFLMLLSWVAIILQFSFASLSVAAGLYYLAELIEEFTSTASKVIRYIILSVLAIYVGFLFFEEFPLEMSLCGIAAQISNLYVMKTFPFFVLSSPSFISTIILIVINHYMAFSHFANHHYQFAEVIAYFTLCLWIVPFAFFVSLSANDYVLPTQAEQRPLLGDDNDVVTNYFGKKGKKYGLLTFFNSAKELVLPPRSKKNF